jgi:hypothetical protein
MLHQFHDNSVLKTLSCRELIMIPVWRGNRYIDDTHVQQIKKDIGDAVERLDTTVFRVVKYMDGATQQVYLIDGQHRQRVLCDYFTKGGVLKEFNVLVMEKEVEGESEVIELFNTLNTVKPQLETDPKLLANKYIAALEKQFNTSKKNTLIRPEGKATKRPFLSSDALRTALEANSSHLKQSNAVVEQFVAKVVGWNERMLREFEIDSACGKKDKKIIDSCLEKKFTLAYDNLLPWVKECLM